MRDSTMSDVNVAADADSVSRGVTLFMQSMIDDPLLGWAFEGIDREGLQRHAFAFVVAALGGPDLYIGRDMRTVHEHLQLGNNHFDASVKHLIESLRVAGIAESVLGELALRLEPLRSQIVTTGRPIHPDSH
jgi:hemoglobin